MATPKPDHMRLAAAERADLAALLRTLTPEQWSTTSLCPAWTVRDVAAHVVSYDGLGKVGLVPAFVRGGLRVDSVNAHVLGRFADLTDEQVADLVEERRRPRGLTAGFGGAIALTDGLIHHQDVRRALGLQRAVPPERLVAALDFALRAPTLPARRNARGLRVVATDVDWTSGDGDEVRGPGEAVLMALAGRPDALADLTGDGLPRLAARLR